MPSFRATIELIGINPYARVPAVHLKTLLRSAARSKGPIPVLVTIEGTSFPQHLVVYQAQWRLYLNLPMRRAAGKDVGDRIALNIEFDPAQRHEPLTPELEYALDQHAPARQAFDALTPSRRKEILRYLNRLQTAATLQANVDKVLRYLLGGAPTLAVLPPRRSALPAQPRSSKRSALPAKKRKAKKRKAP